MSMNDHINSTTTAQPGFSVVEDNYTVPAAKMLYKGTNFTGIFISDKIFLVDESHNNTHIKEWLKEVIKEAVGEMISLVDTCTCSSGTGKCDTNPVTKL